MRLAVLKSNLTRMVPILLAALLLLVLAFFSGAPSTKKTTSDQKPFGSKVQGEQESISADQSQSEDSSEDGNSANDQASTSTKVSISVNSNTTDGETDRSTNVEITTNGQTQDFSDAINECLDTGDIKIRLDGTRLRCVSEDDHLEIKLDSDSSQYSTSESSSELKVTEKKRLH